MGLQVDLSHMLGIPVEMFVILCFTAFLFTFIGKLGVEQPLITMIVFAAWDIFKNTWFIWMPLMIATAIAISILKKR